MHVFISYSHRDKAAVERIADRLRMDGHDVWMDSLKLRPGDNLQRKVQEGLDEADALIVVVSENSRQSRWVQNEFAAIAFQQISRRERRIIPVRLDKAEVPSYLADRVFLDLSENFEVGLARLSETLREGAPLPALRGPAQDDERGRPKSQIFAMDSGRGASPLCAVPASPSRRESQTGATCSFASLRG